MTRQSITTLRTFSILSTVRIFVIIGILFGKQKINVNGFTATAPASPATSSTPYPPDASSSEGTPARPLTQNWWPVTLTSAVSSDRPNAIELLDKRLVLWKSGDDWSCLDDQCSHRFAPLSEGRVVGGSKKCLQCAYHGWEFDGQGGCTKIPQSTASPLSSSAVQSYLVREAGGMLWIWADSDPTTFSFADSITLPISPLLERSIEAYGSEAGFMRDLPYGFELLGENLLDISHLPFSHHSVGLLNREWGGPLPLRMLSRSEKEEKVLWEKEGKTLDKQSRIPLPLFQAEVEDAANYDPSYVALSKKTGIIIPQNATSSSAFYDPCHIRFVRSKGLPGTSVSLDIYMCPTSAGNSRVLFFNASEEIINVLQSLNQNNEKASFRSRWGLSAIKNRIKRAAVSRFYLKWHLRLHSIFDGDGIFLHKQGDRMSQNSLSYRDYITPTPADVLVNAFRRWLNAAALATVTKGQEGQSVATAATGGSIVSPDIAYEIATDRVYLDNKPRSVLLDRYTSHTKHCKRCSSALQKLEQKKNNLNIAMTAFAGAAGASGIGTLIVLFLSVTAGDIPFRLVRACGLAVAASIAGFACVTKIRGNVEETIKQFHFVDYVHADKD